MCVVERDVWSYPVGDGYELRGDDMPNPFEPVRDAPWEDWVPPWDRRRGDGEADEYAAEAEPTRLAWWIFGVGMMLWEVQVGQCPPGILTSCMPEERWLPWALCWLFESEPSRPPRWYRVAARAAWRRRQLGIVHLQCALEGLYFGLERQRRDAARSIAHQAQDGAVLWS